MTWAISVSEWTLRDKDLNQALSTLASLGYDSIELSGRPERRASTVAASLKTAGLSATSVCTVFSENRDYAHPDPIPRRAAVDYLRAVLDQAGELEARVVIVVPTYRPNPLAPRADEFARAAESLATSLEGHPTNGPKLAIEPLNLYETHLVRTLDDADALRRAVGHPSVGVMGDTFHMNIEETSSVDALRKHAPQILHVHLADSNRMQPGAGHVDFAGVGRVLREACYDGTLAMEFLPWTDAAGARGLAYVNATLM